MNDQGELWVIGQGVVSLGFILLPAYPLPFVYPDLVKYSLVGVCGLAALVLIGGGLWYLGKNLTPLPHPKPDANLVTTGVYGWVRHPIYSGVIWLALGFAIWQGSLAHVLGTVGLMLFFDRKASREETWLMDKFPEYHAYQQQVKKLIPFLY
ncbi:MAG: methyltransferase family protein [Pseudanabaenaceae cyanobacterium]